MLHRRRVTRLGAVGVEPRGAPGAALPQQVPELVELHLQRLQPGALRAAPRLAFTVRALERVLLVDELVDVLDDVTVVSHPTTLTASARIWSCCCTSCSARPPPTPWRSSACRDLVGAPTRAGDHVLHPLDVGAVEHGADELELARARLPVPFGHRPDGAVVLDDPVHPRSHRLPAREVAVLVEDARELADLGGQSPLRRQARLGVRDACLAPLGEELVEQLAVGVGDVAEQLVGELAVGLWEVRVGGVGRRVHEGAAATLGGGRRQLRRLDQPVTRQGAQVLTRTADRDVELLGHLLRRGLPPATHGVEHGAPAGRETRDRARIAGGAHRRSALRTMRWLSPNSCHRYPPPSAARYADSSAGRPANASSIIRCVDSGSCQPVSRPSSDRTGVAGVTIRSVHPRPGCTTPRSSVTVASARTTVVPVAITRPPFWRVAFTASAVADGTR